MFKPLNRRLFISGLLSLVAVPGEAAAPLQSLRPHARPGTLPPAPKSADALVKASGLSGRLSYAVAHGQTGQMLEIKDEIGGLPPASVMKAITATYALETLGAGHRFETRVLATGPVAGGVVQGDLVLVGGGDPTLDTDGLVALVAALKGAGVRKVAGRFLVWGGALPYVPEIDTAQPDHVGYNPAISGLALNFNRVHFEWKRTGNGWGVSMDARSKRVQPAVRIARMAIVDRSLPIYTYREVNGVESWTVARGALGKGGSRWLPVRHPDLYAAEVFRVLARAQGIELPEEARATALPEGQVLARRESDSLDVVLRDMLKHSTNLTAEMVGMAASQKRSGAVADLKASAREMQRWAETRLGMANPTFVDHSGLGEDSRITAAGMVSALLVARKLGLKPLLKEVAMRDAKGKVDKNHPLKVAAKTGTLNFASSLAGFVTTPKGGELVFAIFSVDPKRRAAIKEAERENPPGAPQWNKKAKALQRALLERWGKAYG